ncbi:MAG TPA: polyprenyl synthetase family protein [Fibrobacteres bacterium]|jgi:geranylgeranyl diphosphate synthase type II|nr:polyprenyl synthetase family protein [Fibrobacterota bacterium]
MIAEKTPSTVTVEDYLRRASERVNEALDRFLPSEQDRPGDLHKSERYSIFAGGKRLRPALCLAAYEACGGRGDGALSAACALEMVHTFSLIHDDLPCMDDDDFRRGRPTNHKVFGEAMAVLAGDALLVQAFELVAREGNAACALTLAESLGSKGMLGGQVMDILSEGKSVGLETVEFIHLHKTAALIAGSLVMGAQMANAADSTVKELREFGIKIGLGFQIVDDCLDLEQTTETLGKDAKSDLAKGKATYPSVMGLDASKNKARELIDGAVAQLRALPIDGTVLESMARYIITRVN